jgi:hypothetical protein
MRCWQFDMWGGDDLVRLEVWVSHEWKEHRLEAFLEESVDALLDVSLLCSEPPVVLLACMMNM